MKQLVTITLLMSAGNFSRKLALRRQLLKTDNGLFSNAVNAINVNIGNMRRADTIQKVLNPPPKCLIEDLWKKFRELNREGEMENTEYKTPTIRVNHIGTRKSIRVKR
jgi:hypothetical protein